MTFEQIFKVKIVPRIKNAIEDFRDSVTPCDMYSYKDEETYSRAEEKFIAAIKLREYIQENGIEEVIELDDVVEDIDSDNPFMVALTVLVKEYLTNIIDGYKGDYSVEWVYAKGD